MSKIITEAEQLREQVWIDYYEKRRKRVCSRCGDYNKYEIEATEQPIERELNEYFNMNFYLRFYKIKATRILTKNSLEDSAWGDVCNKCKNHILGQIPYYLDNSLEDMEIELQDLKQNERKRQLKQEDEIKKLRKEFNKECRENGSKPKKRHEQTNPNDIKNNNSKRPPT